MLELIVLSIIAGIAGTGLGGLIGICFNGKWKKAMSWPLSFAGGIMVSVVCFELIPEAMELSDIFLTVIAITAGVLVIMPLNGVIDKISAKRQGQKVKTHDDLEGLYHEDELMSGNKKGLLKAGLIMFAAIGLHNLPEGIVIGSGGAHDARLGVLLAVLIALHNIPEGMAVAMPMAAGGIPWWKAVLLTGLSGVPTVIGAILGFVLGGISPAVTAFCLALAGGAMLYVTYCEIMPQAILMNTGRSPAIFTLFGVVVGLLMVYLL